MAVMPLPLKIYLQEKLNHLKFGSSSNFNTLLAILDVKMADMTLPLKIETYNRNLTNINSKLQLRVICQLNSSLFIFVDFEENYLPPPSSQWSLFAPSTN